MKSTVKWTKNLQSVVDNGRGHQIVLDMPEAKNGDNQGATALELAVMSLAGCIVTIFAVVAEKMRIKFTQMEVELDASKTDDDPTITKTEFILKIKTDEPIDKIEKCLKHTIVTCPVGVLFEKAGIPINGKIILL
jgi:putative redox protein